MPANHKAEPRTAQDKAADDQQRRHPNGMTDEQIRETLAALGRRKNDPEYLKTWEEGVAEYRRKIMEEYERDLAEAENK